MHENWEPSWIGLSRLLRETSDKETLGQKQYYDRKMHCQKLIPGDLVLVKQKGSSGNYKIDDKWELNPFRVTEQMTDDKGKLTPVFKLQEIVSLFGDVANALQRLSFSDLSPYHPLIQYDPSMRSFL